MDLTNINMDPMKSTLIITNENGSITLIQENIATDDEKAIIAEFKTQYPNGKHRIISLEDAKTSKIAELNDKCNSTILAGFYSDADGTNKLYDLELENQLNLSTIKNELFVAKIAGQAPETVSYYGKGETCHNYTVDQFLKLATDAQTFKQINITKYKDKLKPMVEKCATIEEVEAITWDTEIPANNP